MATWTTPPTFTSTTLTAAQLNQLIGSGGNLDWLKNALSIMGITADSGVQTVDSAIAGARVFRSTNQSISNGAWTQITFDSERFDLYDSSASTFHSTVSNTGRLTIPAGLGGYYLIGASVAFDINATNRRGVRIVHSVGTTVIAAQLDEAVGSDEHMMSIATLFALSDAEYVTCEVYQNSGGALNIDASSSTIKYAAEFWLTRIGV